MQAIDVLIKVHVRSDTSNDTERKSHCRHLSGYLVSQ